MPKKTSPSPERKKRPDEELGEALRDLRRSGAEPGRKEMLAAVRSANSAVSAYADVNFARSMALLLELAETVRGKRSEQIRALLRGAPNTFGGHEFTWRHRAYRALDIAQLLDPAKGGQARSLFESAVRAERLLISASLDAEAGYLQGLVRGLEEVQALLGAGGHVKSTVRLKLCLLGEGGVGKTSLIRKFVDGRFDSDYHQTIGTQISSKEVESPARDGGLARAMLSVWDIMGHEPATRLRQVYISGADAAVLVFGLDERKSFDLLEDWLYLIETTVGRIPTIVLANKADMKKLELDPGDLPRLPRGWHAEVLQTSAKTGLNVELAFSRIVREVLAARKE